MQVKKLFGLKNTESIHQCLGMILNTEPCEVPFRPNLGIDISGFVDTQNFAGKLRMEIVNKIGIYEPRVELEKVIITQSDLGIVNVKIIYKNKLTGEREAYFN